jgi:type I restriction enzyme S subunit
MAHNPVLLFDVLERTIDNRGKTPPISKVGYPLVEIKHIQSGRLYPVLDDTKFVDQNTWDTWFRGHLQPGDILFSTVGSIARSCIVPDEPKFCIAQNVLAFRVDKSKADPRYIYYAINGGFFLHEVRGRTIETVQKSIKVYDLKTARIPLPALIEQHAIAQILGSLDDKIELSRRMNDTSEAIARALFNSWFVNFDPVRNKAEARKTGLPKHVAHLFPDRFEESEIGFIPGGWEVGSVDDAFHLTMGQSPPGETYNESGDGLPFFQGRADFTFRFPTRRVYCTSPTRFANAGDTLVSVRAPVGDINMASERCAIGRGVAAVRHKTGARSFTYYSMRSLEAAFASFEADGTVFGSINKEDFHKLPCVVPNPEVVHAFERIVGPLDEKIEHCQRESRTLIALRETLLPKLLSGDLAIKDVERILGEHA